MSQNPSQDQPPLRRWLNWRRVLQVALGLSLLLFFLKWIAIQDSFEYLGRIHLWPFIATCLLGFAGTTIRGIRFFTLARSVGTPVTLIQSLLSNYIASFFAIVTPARAGEGGKVLFFQNKKALAACFVFEKLADFGLVLLAGAYGTLVFSRYVNVLVILAALVVIGVIALFNIERILNFVLRREIFKDRWLWKMARGISAGPWTIFVICTVTIWFTGILAQVVCAKALDMTIPIPLMIQVSALTVIAGTLSGTPGGIGTSQFVFTTLLAENTTDDRQVIGVLSILMLLAIYITTLLQGSLGYLVYRIFGIQRWDTPKRSL